jgi:hypothetical protein
MYFDRHPRRLALSVKTADNAAPDVNAASSHPKNVARRKSPAPTHLPNCVVLPVICDTSVPIDRNAITFVYPPIHDSEIASRDFCRNEYARAESI